MGNVSICSLEPSHSWIIRPSRAINSVISDSFDMQGSDSISEVEMNLMTLLETMSADGPRAS